MGKKAVILFSGGSDCTLVAAKVAKQNVFDEIILLTYSVPVSCLDENSTRNVPALKKAFPKVKFSHEMIPATKIFNKVITKNKFRFILKHGLAETNLCVSCRLSMYVRTVIYCIDNNINHVFDGNNVTMALWVEQTRKGCELVDDFFAAFNITMEHPVFYYADDDLFDLLQHVDDVDRKNLIQESTSNELCKLNVIQNKDHKSDYLSSYRSQPVCVGVVLSLLYSMGYKLNFQNYDKFQNNALKWYGDKLDLFRGLLNKYQNNPKKSELGKILM